MTSFPQTSLIPTVVALSTFFAEQFPNISWYPYWYLGNPFYYLSGPILPSLLYILSSLTSLQIDVLYLLLIFLGVLLTAVGTWKLLRSWGVGSLAAFLSAVFYVMFPIGFGLLFFQNGLKHISLSFLPVFIYFLKNYYEKGNLKSLISSFALFTVGLLIDTSVILFFLVSTIALVISLGKVQKREEKIGKIVLGALCALSLASIWYSFEYWGVLLTNPSLGGIPLFNLVTRLFQNALHIVPILLAIVAAKIRNKSFSGMSGFTWLFFATYSMLTISRFLLDPDFVFDWISFGLELQFGIVLLLGVYLKKIHNQKIILCSAIGALCLFLVVDFFLLKSFFSAKDDFFIKKITSIVQSHVSRNERIFLSGSPVFWINQRVNIFQVRGGNDAGSVHQQWAHASYQIREGKDSRLTNAWLEILGSRYVLVHKEKSQEFFHDFDNTQKFQSLQLITSTENDVLYRNKDTNLVRVAEKEILSIPQPSNGADKGSIFRYAMQLHEPLPYQSSSQTLSFTSPVTNSVVSLAVSFSKDWKIRVGDGRLVSDSFGNMVFIPRTENQRVTLVYQRSLWSFLLPTFVAFVTVISVIFYDRFYPIIKKRLPKFSIGLHDDED